MSVSNSLKDTPVCCFENTVNPLEWFGICVRCNCMWLVCTDLKYVEEVQIIFLLLIVMERNCLTTLELFHDVTVATTSKMIYSQLPCQTKLFKYKSCPSQPSQKPLITFSVDITCNCN